MQECQHGIVVYPCLFDFQVLCANNWQCIVFALCSFVVVIKHSMLVYCNLIITSSTLVKYL